MFNAEAWRQIFSVQSAAWTATAFIFLFTVRMWNGAPAMFAQWVAWRRARADEKAADWQRLREENQRIDARCQRLEAAEERCREELAGVKQRLASLEGWLAGQGQAHQEAAGVVALERLEHHKEKEKKDQQQ